MSTARALAQRVFGQGSPLAMQIVVLLIGSLLVAQAVTLGLTLLLPPKPAAEYKLDDIARALKGGALQVDNPRPLVRLLRSQPPSTQSASWLVSERSRDDLARLVGAAPGDVRLLFYSPLPFAGASGLALDAPQRSRVATAGFLVGQMAPGGGGPGAGAAGGGFGSGFPGGGFGGPRAGGGFGDGASGMAKAVSDAAQATPVERAAGKAVGATAAPAPALADCRAVAEVSVWREATAASRRRRRFPGTRRARWWAASALAAWTWRAR